MPSRIKAVLAKISEKQAKYTENDKQYWIAEQIKDIASESEVNAEHILKTSTITKCPLMPLKSR